MELLTINECGRRGPLKPWRLREMQKQGRLPGVFAASRYYVDYDALLRMLEAESARNAGGMSVEQ